MKGRGRVAAPEGRVEHLELTLVKGHWIVHQDGRCFLIDSGSPVSLGRGVGLRWRGRTVRLEPGLIDLATVSGMIGAPVDGLVGMDLLAEVPFRLDAHAGRLTLDAPAEGPGSLRAVAEGRGVPLREVAVDDLLGVPIVRCTLDGREQSAYLDTGAALPFFPPPTHPAARAVRRHSDFLPGLTGLTPIEVDVHLRDLGLGGITRGGVEVGTSPDQIRLLGSLTGIAGILSWPPPSMALAELRMGERRLMLVEAG